MAYGGVFAALALVIMCMGGLIPIATYVCPMLCTILNFAILRLCGKRIAWVWYAVVALLSLLLGPDKEAAAVFLVLGYYPIVKPWFDSFKAGKVLKLVLFNVVVVAMYLALIYVFGMDAILSEFQEMGYIGLAVMLVLGNVTFLLVDRLLNMLDKKKWKRRTK